MQRSTSIKIFWLLLILTFASLQTLSNIDESLRSPIAPAGIVSFEVCAYRGSCQAMMDAWAAHAQTMAALSLGFDYLFMALYSATIFVGLLLAAAYVPARLKKITVCSAWLAWLAGIADAIENYGLIQMLLTQNIETFAWPAAISATVKFIVLGYTSFWLLAMYCLFGWRKKFAS
jgi:hypothetical protein